MPNQLVKCYHEPMDKSFLVIQQRIFLVICALITAPFLLLSIFGQIKNENALILLPLFVLGLPWVFFLPSNISGFTSAGTPDAMGNLVVSPLDIFLLLIPVCINIYIITFILFKIISLVFHSRMS